VLESESSESVEHCSTCGRNVPVANLTTHRAHCGHSHTSSSSSSCVTSSKATPKKKSRKQAKSEAVEEDLDALLAEMSVSDTACGLAGCRRKPSLIGQRCSLCRRLFCVEHSIPEVHGCGKAAKERARRQHKKSAGTDNKQCYRAILKY